MEIIQNTNHFTGETSYSIFIKQGDDINEWDIARCFKEQYPNKTCAISFSRIVQVECGLLLVGLKPFLEQEKLK